MDHGKFTEGSRVYILGKKTVLQRPLDCPGGWVVDPPVLNIRYWNEDEMMLSYSDDPHRIEISP